MTREDKYKRFHEIWTELEELYRSKNEKYNDSFGRTVQQYGVIAALTRLSDKWNRLENLVLNPELDTAKDESLRDTIRDKATYLIMFLIELEVMDEPNVFKPNPSGSIGDRYNEREFHLPPSGTGLSDQTIKYRDLS